MDPWSFLCVVISPWTNVILCVHWVQASPHVYDVVDGDVRLAASVRVQIVQEQFIITDDDELPLPSLLDPAGLRYLFHRKEP